MKKTWLLVLLVFFTSCQQEKKTIISDQYLTVLGTAQDAGYPQINCHKTCCQPYHEGKVAKKLISCLGLIDLKAKKKWIFDATPDIAQQIQHLSKQLETTNVIDGVFLTHAHIGHYTGLMYFGREAMDATQIPVYAMPKMKNFLETNGPWSQLVSLKNIALKKLSHNTSVELTNGLQITPFLVPHRDEFSETVGYRIQGQHKSALFIPDINKWQLWEKNIVAEVKKVDYAFLDATFFKDGEIPRPMSEVPHPFIVETAKLFENEDKATKNKVIFIHFNHSNPALQDANVLKDSLEAQGFQFAEEGMRFGL
ncbi:coenzyme PQQ synthesis protein B [Kordia sp. SMS9]|uniref:MBL fold metallo-hydrolase n=1 Tax=Kordia sp. SMS9 TaxID=2282170 RepID=UPI000E0DE20E|nr:MBL fold metallo-hydrolase [Kordia sp. SMS9]AXG72197.1 coenzyme PQQ synthesis protein B [Kordia sp. SMS9]